MSAPGRAFSDINSLVIKEVFALADLNFLGPLVRSLDGLLLNVYIFTLGIISDNDLLLSSIRSRTNSLNISCQSLGALSRLFDISGSITSPVSSVTRYEPVSL